LVEIDGEPAVLRRPPSGPPLPGANDTAREHRILSSLWRAYPLEPRALYFCDDTRVLGAPFQIIEYRPGIVIRDTLPPNCVSRLEVGTVFEPALGRDMGTRGDSLWDLAVLLSYRSEPGDPDCMYRMRQMPTAQPGFWRRGEVLEAYALITGRAIDDFIFYRVLSLFRSAIVLLQLYDRYRRDPASHARCGEFDKLGRDLLDYALAVAQGRAD
jgi:aminoglycoside phosphotransferase (APT) family kinase protein